MPVKNYSEHEDHAKADRYETARLRTALEEISKLTGVLSTSGPVTLPDLTIIAWNRLWLVSEKAKEALSK